MFAYPDRALPFWYTWLPIASPFHDSNLAPIVCALKCSPFSVWQRGTLDAPFFLLRETVETKVNETLVIDV
jgi:hypothetical protein